MKRSSKARKTSTRDGDYEEFLLGELKDPQFAVAYLNAALRETGPGAEERFLMALRHVAQAHGMTSVAERAGMARQAMYRALSDRGNPEFMTLRSVLGALGLRLTIQPIRKSKAS